MQQLADELSADGHIEFKDNPDHKTSKLATITKKGETAYRRMLAGLQEIGAFLAQDIPDSELKSATAVLRKIRSRAVLT